MAKKNLLTTFESWLAEQGKSIDELSPKDLKELQNQYEDDGDDPATDFDDGPEGSRRYGSQSVSVGREWVVTIGEQSFILSEMAALALHDQIADLADMEDD